MGIGISVIVDELAPGIPYVMIVWNLEKWVCVYCEKALN